jgi:predicted Zn-dependent protease
MKTIKILLFLLIGFSPILFVACEKNPDDKTINIFSVEDDKTLGLQTKTEIFNDPVNFPILDSIQYADAYTYLRGIVKSILDADKVYYKDEFPWETYIIKDDNVLNAFCAPGGYIFVYTGLIKYLDSEDELAGVLGHEIAHADRRHTTDQLTKQYGVGVLLDVVFGRDNNALKNIVSNLLSLKYSRTDETEADKYSVIYLCPTQYRADGAAGFFKKLIDSGQGTGNFEFLSTHPNPDNRVENIEKEKTDRNCPGTDIFTERYNNFKNVLLP